MNFLTKRQNVYFASPQYYGNALAGFSPPRKEFPGCNRFWKDDRTNNEVVCDLYFLLPKAHFLLTFCFS